MDKDAHLPRPLDVIPLQRNVLCARLRIFHELHRRADERYAAIAVGMNVNGNLAQIGLLSSEDHLFDRSVFHCYSGCTVKGSRSQC